MHILLIHRAFAQSDQPGGTRHIELGRILTAKGFRMTVVTASVSYLNAASGVGGTPLPERESLEPGIEVIRCTAGTSARHLWGRFQEMFGFMLSSFWKGLSIPGVDLVWATSPTLFQALAAALVAKLKRKPLLLEIRDIWPDALEDIGALCNPVAIAIANALAKWLYRQATCIVINSPGFRRHLMAKGVPDKKLFLVANGVDTTMFNPADRGSNLRSEMGWDDQFVALYSGAHGMANDLDAVLEAASLLSPHPRVRVILLGDGPEKPRLKGRAEQMGLSNVEFLDPVPKSAMPSLLAATDCCIAHLKPSAMQAMVYPNKVFDYMAAGRPTVLGIGGVIREVIEGAQGGIPTEPGDARAMADAIEFLSRSPEVGRQMGINARAFVERNFQRQAIADSLLHVLGVVARG